MNFGKSIECTVVHLSQCPALTVPEVIGMAVEVGEGVLFSFSMVAAFDSVQSQWEWIKMR